jgi:hypothetical protein
MMERGRKTHASHASKSATNDLLSIQRCKGTNYDLFPSSSQPAPRAIRVHIWVSLRLRKSRPGTPLSLEDALRLVEGYVEHYNNVRLNSAVGYVTPKEMLAGRRGEIHAERDRKLEEARKQRQIRRQQACVKNEEAQPPGSAEAPDQFGSLPEVLLARSPWPTHLGPVYEKPISQGVFRQSAWPSHTAPCGYLAIAK